MTLEEFEARDNFHNIPKGVYEHVVVNCVFAIGVKNYKHCSSGMVFEFLAGDDGNYWQVDKTSCWDVAWLKSFRELFSEMEAWVRDRT